MTRVAILGATGYSALELIKILLHHPHADNETLVEAAKAWGWLVPLGHARPKRNGPEPGGRDETLRNP